LVDLSEVDVVYLDTPYYVVPDDKIGDETFIVLREAMAKPISKREAVDKSEQDHCCCNVCQRPVEIAALGTPQAPAQ
jgi:hypothetical protein